MENKSFTNRSFSSETARQTFMHLFGKTHWMIFDRLSNDFVGYKLSSNIAVGLIYFEIDSLNTMVYFGVGIHCKTASTNELK